MGCDVTCDARGGGDNRDGWWRWWGGGADGGGRDAVGGGGGCGRGAGGSHGTAAQRCTALRRRSRRGISLTMFPTRRTGRQKNEVGWTRTDLYSCTLNPRRRPVTPETRLRSTNHIATIPRSCMAARRHPASAAPHVRPASCWHTAPGSVCRARPLCARRAVRRRLLTLYWSVRMARVLWLVTREASAGARAC